MKKKKIFAIVLSVAMLGSMMPAMAFATEANTTGQVKAVQNTGIEGKKTAEVFPDGLFRKVLVNNGYLNSADSNHIITKGEATKISQGKELTVYIVAEYAYYPDEYKDIVVQASDEDVKNKFSFKGIEYFASLEKLDMNGHEISTGTDDNVFLNVDACNLDLGKYIGNLKKLTTLKISNYNITDNLNLSNFPNLKSVEIMSCKISAPVKITNNDNLTEVVYYDANVRNKSCIGLDVSNNKNLAKLDVEQSDIYYLDLTNDESLDDIEMGSSNISYIKFPENKEFNLSNYFTQDAYRVGNSFLISMDEDVFNENNIEQLNNLNMGVNDDKYMFFSVKNFKKPGSYVYKNGKSKIKVNFYAMLPIKVTLKNEEKLQDVDWVKYIENVETIDDWFKKQGAKEYKVSSGTISLTGNSYFTLYYRGTDVRVKPMTVFVDYKYDGNKQKVLDVMNPYETYAATFMNSTFNNAEKEEYAAINVEANKIVNSVNPTDEEVDAFAKKVKDVHQALFDKYGVFGEPNDTTDTDGPTNHYVESAPIIKGKWIKDKGGVWSFKTEGGQVVKDTIVRINNNTYKFDAEGHMETGWHHEKGGWYYFNKKGEGTEGALFKDEWKKIDGKWYYFYGYGKMAENTMIGSSYVNNSGVWVKDKWVKSGNRYWLSLAEGGYPKSEHKTINGNDYYFDNGGWMKTGWHYEQGTWYYFNKKGEGTEGAMFKKGWKKISGKWYYFYKDGKMAADAMVGSSYVNHSGVWVKDKWVKSGSRYWYKQEDGKYPKSEFKTINKKTYYFDNNGWMDTGWLKKGDTWYYFNKKGQGTEGAMVEDAWRVISGKWYYFDGNGKMLANTIKSIKGTSYHFRQNGTMDTGWVKDGADWYYFNKKGEGTEGAMAKEGWKKINDKWYYFYESGKMAKSTSVGNYKVDSSGAWVK